MYTEYVLTDRSTSTKYAITISDGAFTYNSTTNPTNSEPIFRDIINTSDYFKLYISDNQVAIESTVTVQDDNITLFDSVLSRSFKLIVSEGNFGYQDISSGIIFLIPLNSRIDRTILLESLV